MTNKEHDEVVERCAALVDHTTHDGSDLSPLAAEIRALKREPSVEDAQRMRLNERFRDRKAPSLSADDIAPPHLD